LPSLSPLVAADAADTESRIGMACFPTAGIDDRRIGACVDQFSSDNYFLSSRCTGP